MNATTRPTNNFDTTAFEELKFQTHPMGIGQQCIVQFSNGYAASIVQNEFSYGGKDGLYELAVFDRNGHITYDTPITDDVLGYLTEEDVQKTLTNIKNLD
jgi:hypothetical protein